MRALLERIETDYPEDFEKVNGKRKSRKGYNPNRDLALSRLAVAIGKLDLDLAVKILKYDVNDEYSPEEKQGIVDEVGQFILDKLKKGRILDLYDVYCKLFGVDPDSSKVQVHRKTRSQKRRSMKRGSIRLGGDDMGLLATVQPDMLPAAALPPEAKTEVYGFGEATYSDGDISDGSMGSEFGFN